MALRTWTPWAWGSGVHCLGGLGRWQLTARMATPFLLPLVCFALLGQGSPVTQDDLGTDCVAKDDLELPILLQLPLQCWDYRNASPCPVYLVLRMEPRASCILACAVRAEPSPALGLSLDSQVCPSIDTSPLRPSLCIVF